jgi:hypothetical protein
MLILVLATILPKHNQSSVTMPISAKVKYLAQINFWVLNHEFTKWILGRSLDGSGFERDRGHHIRVMDSTTND